MTRRPLLQVEVFTPIKIGISPASVKRLAEHVLNEEGMEGIRTIAIVFVGDPEIQRLNLRFLKRNQPTDVMAFPFDEPEGPSGEVYVSVDRAKEQALRYGIPMAEELSRLVIHGVLHLLEYDDRDIGLRKIMRAQEEHYLKSGPRIGLKGKV